LRGIGIQKKKRSWRVNEQGNGIHFAPHRDVCAQMFKHCGSRRKKWEGFSTKAIPKTEPKLNQSTHTQIQTNTHTHTETDAAAFCLKFVFEWKTFVKINYEFVRSIVFR